MVSIIIPTYNEENCIPAMLGQFERVRGNFEVIVADGSSTDRTRDLVLHAVAACPYSLRLVRTVHNRAMQLNAAAEQACGDSFLFLHADVLLPADAVESIEERLLDTSVIGGNFRLVFEGNSPVARFFTWCYKARRPFGIYYGDSGLFVRCEVFSQLGGFKAIPIMDDYEFVRRMERAGRTVCLKSCLVASDRRWQVQGLFPTLFSWIWIQTLYSLGMPAEHLARWYRPVRKGKRPPSM